MIQAAESDAKIGDAVVKNLEKFGKERYEPARALLRSDTQQREFLREHIAVSVSEQDSGDLKISALHREAGGMVSSREDTIILPKNEVAQKLTAIIAEAFQRAT